MLLVRPPPRPRTRVVQTQAVRFLVVGAVAAVADYLVYVIAMGLGVAVSPAKAAGFVVGTGLAYAANRRWTFRARHGHRRLGRFLVVYALTLGVNVATNSVLLEVLPSRAGAVTGAWAIAQALTSALNFVAMRHYVFTDRAP